MKTKNPEEAMRRALEDACHRSVTGQHVILTIEGKTFYVVMLPLADDIAPANDDDTFSRPWMGDFLEWLRKGRTVREAAELSGVTKRHAHRSYHRDLRFAQAWDAIRKVPR